MINDQQQLTTNLHRLETDLWEAADQLRANSKLTATEYSMPVLGLIFLRHATNRFEAVKAAIEPTLPTRGGVRAPLKKENFQGRSAIFLPEQARYDTLVNLPGSADIGQAIVDAMDAIEKEVPMLAGALPKAYTRFDPDLLRRLLRIFDSEALRTASGDLFGRIYEYFLNKFAQSGAQEGGEYFTPPSIVRTIVNVIEPEHGTVFDPAAGSGGMFVQTSYFIEQLGRHATESVTFYGQERSDTNSRLARMNMAVHGLEAKIQVANTYYEDPHHLRGRCDFVMANPPFNVDGVDPDKVKNDPRLFTTKTIPGVNKKSGGVSNANYLWIQYFYSYLNDSGRAGFVMASSASDAGYGEKEIRQEIIDTGHVDVMVAIGTNFFYTRSLPCTLWFFDRGQPAGRQDTVLMIDARNIYRVISRKLRDFSDEQLQNLTAIVWLYRGETDRFLGLVAYYLAETKRRAARIGPAVTALDGPLDRLTAALTAFEPTLTPDPETGLTAEAITAFRDLLAEQGEALAAFRAGRAEVVGTLETMRPPDPPKGGELLPSPSGRGAGGEGQTNPAHHTARSQFEPLVPRLRALQKQLGEVCKLTLRALDMAERTLNARKADNGDWDSKAVREARDGLEAAREMASEAIKQTLYIFNQVQWLHQRFPEAEYADVPGLCKIVTRAELAQHDHSLTPGRYVGVAPPDYGDDEDFEARLTEIHLELAGLNEEAAELAATIEANFEDLSL